MKKAYCFVPDLPLQAASGSELRIEFNLDLKMEMKGQFCRAEKE
jgi:hypothetical protein